ncbi:RNA dependent RNA polymerase-domain-containing protein [Phycomyces nitens]|nr:RNA dependent RNA polymerase-domain-containing protein [Phycomyces nitens]
MSYKKQIAGQSQRNGSFNRSVQNMSYLITNLDHQTLPNTIMNVFQKYGTVRLVELGLNGNECADGTATVQFRGTPQNLDINTKGLKIDGRTVKIEPRPDFSPSENRNGRVMNKERFGSRSFSMGTMVEPDTLAEHWITQQNCALIVNFDMRQYQVFFDHGEHKYRAEFKFKELLEGVKIERENNTWYFTFQLRYPARFWRQNPNAIRETNTTLVTGSQWERVVAIPMEASGSTTPEKGVSNENKKSPVTLILPPGMIQLGSWLVYRLRMEVNSRYENDFYQQLDKAADYNVVPRNLHNMRYGLSLKVISSKTLPKWNTHLERATMFPYDVLYMLESVILNHYFDEANLDDDFYEMVKKLPPSITCGILDIISLDKKRVWDPENKFREIWNNLRMKVCHKRKIPDHCTLMRKMVVTPTSIYIQPPSLETTNRVIRHFRSYSDRFIRVQFCDDGMNRISASHTGLSNNEVYDRIYKVLTNGIQIGTRRYDFLAFSNSQLRDHGCWFFAPTKDMTASMIRDWMGRFSHVKIVAKNATRMGQCFSSTRPICQLKKEEIEHIPDVERNGYTFSDGVGMISPALAREISSKMELRHVPSAFQFRLAGAKGVLTVANGLSGRKVKMRPSQIKFDSDHLVLEVIRFSTSIPAYLNKQIITILSALGVKDEVFMTLMDDMLKTLNDMLSNPSEAIKVLNSNIDEFGTTQTMVRMIQAGFMDRKDPYTVNLLNMFRVSMLKNLKKKTKINVPNGAFLLGVMDETGSLQEGEVFCQVTEPSSQSSRKRIITGDIVVYRNPCFHPGDVRVVNAVDCPKLRHLSDVVVFSSQGFRDIPSMCSGGDLDGDDYTIYWDQRLLPPTRNYTPMDYEPEKPLQVDEVHISHILKFYINYMNNDNLGQIANAHLATADMSYDGALNGSCKHLAQLHSSAVGKFARLGLESKYD